MAHGPASTARSLGCSGGAWNDDRRAEGERLPSGGREADQVRGAVRRLPRATTVLVVPKSMPMAEISHDALLFEGVGSAARVRTLSGAGRAGWSGTKP